MDDFNRKRHAVYKLTYHAVFVIKYRRKVMSEPIIEHMRQYAAHLIGQCYQGRLIELNGEPDHIHILFELPATAAPSVVVCSLKTQLSKEIRANFWDEIKDKLWNNIFWSDSYFITTTGGADIETLEKYIQDQGIEKPKRKYTKRQTKKMCEKDSHLILPDLFLLCRIHPRPTMSDEVFCGEMDKSIKGQHWIATV